MKNKVIFFFTLISNFVIAQQNFINVPSSEVTIKNKYFFQQQINFNDLIQSNTTLDYGLGKGYEIGLNILGINFDQNRKIIFQNNTSDIEPYSPLILLNGLKQINVSNHFSMSFGSQLGLNFIDNKRNSGAALCYLNFHISDLVITNSILVMGSYFNSIHYGGNGNRFGAWGGIEIPITSYFHINAESILGDNSISYTSLGIIVYPIKWMPLTIGFQIPNTNKNSYSFVFELTIIPHVKKE